MKYTEVIIDTKDGGIDECCDKLNALGLCEYVIENESDFREFLENNRQYWDYVDKELEESYSGASRIKIYLEDNDEGAAMLAAIKNEGFEIKMSIVDDSDWENNWKQYFKPLEIGERLIVVPEWEQTDINGRVPLRLDPGLRQSCNHPYVPRGTAKLRHRGEKSARPRLWQRNTRHRRASSGRRYLPCLRH